MDDVTTALLNPKTLSSIFEKSPLMDMASIRSILESVVLCSIMKLDSNSMNKLFDLMTMMFKYQLTAATGPREVILITLNHTDAMRDMVTDESAHECVSLVHQMIVDLYANLRYEEVWQARNDCLDLLRNYNVRVNVLLRLGLQNQNATFNIGKPNYNERYEKQRAEIGQLKLTDIICEKCTIGSFNLFGDRITVLGKNIYSPSFGKQPKPCLKRTSRQLSTDPGCKAELGMLALQLGTEETIYERPFSLTLYVNDKNTNSKSEINIDQTENYLQDDDEIEGKSNKNKQEYKNKLESLYGDLEDDSNDIKRSMDLLDLLDEV
ncbi:protein OSCP1 isoform X2 [Belonocnema kinseyi]|nr:protein OSCP1 isoform X2 [Belonocnema kinseyi]